MKRWTGLNRFVIKTNIAILFEGNEPPTSVKSWEWLNCSRTNTHRFSHGQKLRKADILLLSRGTEEVRLARRYTGGGRCLRLWRRAQRGSQRTIGSWWSVLSLWSGASFKCREWHTSASHNRESLRCECTLQRLFQIRTSAFALSYVGVQCSSFRFSFICFLSLIYHGNFLFFFQESNLISFPPCFLLQMVYLNECEDETALLSVL